MLNKPENYDAVEVQEFDFEPLELGGHKCVIVSAEEYTSPTSGKTSLKISVDTTKLDKQPNYYQKIYDNNKLSEAKWPSGAVKYISLGNDENCVKMLKGFITAVENSNANFKYDWSKNVVQLEGKLVGGIFGLEEYQNNEGKVKNATKLRNFRSIDKVKDAKIPKVKLLDGSYIDWEDYDGPENETTSSPFESTVSVVSDGDLPF